MCISTRFIPDRKIRTRRAGLVRLLSSWGRCSASCNADKSLACLPCGRGSAAYGRRQGTGNGRTLPPGQVVAARRNKIQLPGLPLRRGGESRSARSWQPIKLTWRLDRSRQGFCLLFNSHRLPFPSHATIFRLCCRRPDWTEPPGNLTGGMFSGFVVDGCRRSASVGKEKHGDSSGG